MKRIFLLNVKISKCSVVVQLLAGKYEPLLVCKSSFPVHNFFLYHMNGVRWLNFEADGLTSKGLYENLHRTKKKA